MEGALQSGYTTKFTSKPLFSGFSPANFPLDYGLTARGPSSVAKHPLTAAEAEKMQNGIDQIKQMIGAQSERLGLIDDAITKLMQASAASSEQIQALGHQLDKVGSRLEGVDSRLVGLDVTAKETAKEAAELKKETLSLGIKISSIDNDIKKLPDKSWVHQQEWKVLSGALIGVTGLLTIFKYVLPG